MAGRIMSKPGRARVLSAIHEQTALAGLIAIAVHGITLLGDAFLSPGIAGITIPGAISYRPLWTGLGIAGGYLAAALGLSFYIRKSIGPRLWRRAHRLRRSWSTALPSPTRSARAPTRARRGCGPGCSRPRPVIGGLFVVRATSGWRKRRAGGRARPREADPRAEIEGGIA